MTIHKLHVCQDCSRPHGSYLCRHVRVIKTLEETASVYTREVDCPHCLAAIAEERPARV